MRNRDIVKKQELTRLVPLHPYVSVNESLLVGSYHPLSTSFGTARQEDVTRPARRPPDRRIGINEDKAPEVFQGNALLAQ